MQPGRGADGVTTNDSGRRPGQDDGHDETSDYGQGTRTHAQRIVIPLRDAGPSSAPGDDAPADPDTAWLRAVEMAIGRLAAADAPFCTDDVRRELAGADPRHPSQWGGVFLRARRDGVIRKVGVVTSTRAVRHTGLLHYWEGVR